MPRMAGGNCGGAGSGAARGIGESTGTTIIVDGGQTLPEGADFRINPE